MIGAAAAAVVGLDLSLTATGVCAWFGATTVIKPHGLGDERLPEIRDHIRVFAVGAQLVVMEGMLVRSATAPFTGMVHGIARVALMDMGVPYAVVPPATLKKYATGKGNADKTAMALAAFKRFGREFPDDNACDAFWLHAMGCHALGHPMTDLPIPQVEQLTRVHWPEPRALEVG